MQFKILVYLCFVLGGLFSSNLTADTTSASSDVQVGYLVNGELSEVSLELSQVDFDSDAEPCYWTLNSFCTSNGCLRPGAAASCHVFLRFSTQPRAPPY